MSNKYIQEDIITSDNRAKQLTIGIIGFGQMGKLWAKHMHKIGLTVLIYDSNYNNLNLKEYPDYHFVSLPELCNNSLHIHVLVPILKIKEICNSIKHDITPEQLLILGTSVMYRPYIWARDILDKNIGIVLGHALFGPQSGKDSIENFNFVLAKQQVVTSYQEELYQDFQVILKKLQLQIFHKDVLEHDKLMAKTQALSHLIGRLLAEMNLGEEDASILTYKKLVDIKNAISLDSEQLFLTIQTQNPYTKDMHKNMLHSLIKLENEINTFAMLYNSNDT